MPVIDKDSFPVLRPFIFHGIYLTPSNGQGIGNCPFCQREDKFYVNANNGKWDCKVCSRKGNPISFLQELHAYCMESTTEDQYRELAQNRKLATIEPLIKWGFCWSHLRDEWIVPGYHEGSDKVKQLYRWSDYQSKDGKRHLIATPPDGVTDEIKHCLYGVRMYDKSKQDVYLLEGPWDAVSLWEVLRLAKVTEDGTFEMTGSEAASLLRNINILAVPSTTTFTENWAQLLKGKRVFLLGHNDHPRTIDMGNGKIRTEEPASYKGIKRMVSLMMQWDIRPTELYYLAWGHANKEQSHNPLLKHGYDVRDLLAGGYITFPSGVSARLQTIETKIKHLDQFYSLLKPVPQQWIDPTEKDKTKVYTTRPSSRNGKHSKQDEGIGIKCTPCDSWKELISKWEQSVIWHDGLEKTLGCGLACIMSTNYPGTQLWLRVVSEPSSGKSLLADAFCVNHNHVTMQSNIRGFFSGVRATEDDKRQGKDDLGLVMEILGKTFVTKDGDTILNGPDRPRIMAEARDLYDGKTATHFRLGTGRKYNNHRTTWILMGTERILDVNDNDLGARFLDCRLIKDMAHQLRSRIARKAISNMRSMMKHKVTSDVESMEEPHMLIAKKMTGGYIEYLCTKCEDKLQQVVDTPDDEADDIIETLALFTSYMRARPSKKDENVQVELHARLSEQLFRLAACLTVVMNKEKIDREVIRRVMEIAFDTSEGSTLKMCRFLYNNQHGATYNTLNAQIEQRDDKITELLRFLKRINVFEVYNDKTYKTYGEPKYKLTRHMRGLCDKVFTYEL